MRHRGTWLLVAAGALAVLVAVGLLVAGLDTAERDIAKRPTRSQLLAALDDLRRDQRRACRVVNARFAHLARLIEGQRPSAATTDYYRTHPDELARAQQHFDATIRALRPRNCLRAYPPPTRDDLTASVIGGGGAASGATSRQPP